MTIDLSVSLGSLDLATPLVAASGTCGYGRELAGLSDLSAWGAMTGKTITLEPREGNPPPRTHETAAGMLNSIGLQNPGVDRFLEEHWPAFHALHPRVIVNIAADTPEDLGRLAGRLAPIAAQAAALELNLSCPNVRGGLTLGVDPELTREAVSAVRSAWSGPIIAKLSPHGPDLPALAAAAVEGGADALCLLNTFVGLAVDWRRRRPVLGGRTGGLSGPAIKPLVLRLVAETARAVDAPILATGGVSRAEDVLEYMVAGASAVGVGTAIFRDPRVAERLVLDLKARLAEEKVGSLREIVGTLEW